jgi:hypothetical protein
MRRQPGRPATPVRPLRFNRSREAGAVASAPIIGCQFATDTMSDAARRPASASGSIADFTVADRSLHLSRYGRLISGRGGRGTARRVVRPVLTSAETHSAIGIDQNRDGGRGGRPTSDPRRPESPFAGRVSRRRTGAQVDFGVPGRVLCPMDDHTVNRSTPTQNRPPKSASSSSGGDLIGRQMTASQGGDPPTLMRPSIRS